MTARQNLSRLVRRFARDRRAMGAVEFAMVTPFLLTLYLGGSQLSMALTIDRKVDNAAATINDLITQSNTTNTASIAGLMNVAKSILTPYDLAPLRTRITQVKIDDKGIAKVDWDYPTGGLPKLAKGSIFKLPTDFSSFPDRYLVVAQTSYTYTPVAGYFITGSIQMGGTTYLNPRNGTRIDCTDC
ncbi:MULTISPECIES: TadE/TadG family type IV pilus assembly protein [unclassified Aureimonas]|uniref:TadE/TadG family type IV pilus assembly protein n=1 Tax=unclassified Aureimonas TaxID=2615206 RepID=UPI0006FF4E9B|nr:MULTISPECIES: TadE/TadG family type IV pilus assembly protein [unclassified Aureimonas]KQT53856.1 hypothetical protein ASG62_11465 [Aureimonas sp. Leaf427]KQT71703.1 hypothetical protein ASG54_19695 [Aureimonas sp. Leaf460]